ncbi:MAG TPA: hypothetical protein VI197_15685, partial [Polyangiaceae bacterium]
PHNGRTTSWGPDMNLPLFLTAYDPTDLPGTSIDPLGFGVGYGALAEALLPGLTGAAAEPAYFPVLCAGILWADEAGAASKSRIERKRFRQEVAMRLERAWGLAVTLYARSLADGHADVGEEPEPGGILLRGVTYFQRECERLGRTQLAGTRFKVLARQAPYGMLGIYANITARLGLIDTDDYALTSALGVPVAEAFIEQTLPGAARQEIKRLAVDPTATVSRDLLRQWGRRCHDPRGWPQRAANSLRAGLLRDPQRASCLRLVLALRNRFGQLSNELELLTEALRLAQNDGGLPLRSAEKARLTHLLEASVAFEESYRRLMVVFERLLWLARDQNRQTGPASIASDDVLACCQDSIQAVGERLHRAQQGLRDFGLHEEAHQLDDAVRFVDQARIVRNVDGMVGVVLERHCKVQQSKVDRGRRKLPWVELRQGLLTLTSLTNSGQRGVVTKPEQIPLHAWRLYPALNYLGAIGGEL